MRAGIWDICLTTDSNGCHVDKGHPPSADLRYGEKDSISPSILIFATVKSLLEICTPYIPPDVHKKLPLI